VLIWQSATIVAINTKQNPPVITTSGFFHFAPKFKKKNTLSLRLCFFGFGGRAPSQLVGIVF